MRFLLTNDDGIDAPGLRVLEQAARLHGAVHVLAPKDAHSGCSHLTTTHRPLTLTECGPGRTCVDGSPADCTRIGLSSLGLECDWVLSGVNAGGNLGVDIFLSGTVAAVREAALLGTPGIAFSQLRRRSEAFDWEQVAPWVAELIGRLTREPPTPRVMLNVNLPHLPAGAPMPTVVHCPVDSNPLPVRYRRDGNTLHYDGEYHNRARSPGGDVAVCFGGAISVSPLRLL
jgi:5'-nucleotidase